MKLKGTNYITSALCLLALSGGETQAGTMGPAQVTGTEKVYFGIFGGGGSSEQVRINQSGSIFFVEATGGPLAVNTFGHTNSRDVGLVGGQLGYQWLDISVNSLNHQINLTPAVELEGYYVGKSSFNSYSVNSDTTRIIEQDFFVSYPMSTGVFLANTVLNFNSASYARWRPYVGAGIGAAVLSISNADSLQLSPVEPNINHYNGNPNVKGSAFAAQTKVGLNFALSEHVSLFAEYRWLYIASTNFTFGSTVSPEHAPTSGWNVNFGPQRYNMGSGGIRFTV